jgi:hypothetical protein
MIQEIIGKVKELFRSSPPTPGKDQDKKTLVYLFVQRDTDRSSYNLWLNGEQTDRYVTESEIRKMLSKDQYRLFLNGEIIFEVPESKVMGKEQKRRLVHTPIDSSVYDARESYKRRQHQKSQI